MAKRNNSQAQKRANEKRRLHALAQHRKLRHLARRARGEPSPTPDREDSDPHAQTMPGSPIASPVHPDASPRTGFTAINTSSPIESSPDRGSPALDNGEGSSAGSANPDGLTLSDRLLLAEIESEDRNSRVGHGVLGIPSLGYAHGVDYPDALFQPLAGPTVSDLVDQVVQFDTLPSDGDGGSQPPGHEESQPPSSPKIDKGKGKETAVPDVDPASKWAAFNQERERLIALSEREGSPSPGPAPSSHGDDGDSDYVDDANDAVRSGSPEPEVEAGPSRSTAKGAKARREAKLKARREAKKKNKGKEVAGRREKGAKRSALCLNCLKSVLAGKMKEGDWCHDTDPAGSRCYKCASGHSCGPIPSSVLPFAKRFLLEVEDAKKDSSASVGADGRKKKEADLVGRWRVATKLAIELAEDLEAEGSSDEPDADLQDMDAAELRAAALAAQRRAFDAGVLLARRRRS